MHYRYVDGGEGVGGSSEDLPRKVKAMSKTIKSLLEYMGSKERDISYQSVRKTCEEITDCIRAFKNSLYAQKHAYYFRRLREWEDYNKV